MDSHRHRAGRRSCSSPATRGISWRDRVTGDDGSERRPSRIVAHRPERVCWTELPNGSDSSSITCGARYNWLFGSGSSSLRSDLSLDRSFSTFLLQHHDTVDQSFRSWRTAGDVDVDRDDVVDALDDGVVVEDAVARRLRTRPSRCTTWVAASAARCGEAPGELERNRARRSSGGRPAAARMPAAPCRNARCRICWPPSP
jgi:hypothetical protein